jgi:hypothetical protein
MRREICQFKASLSLTVVKKTDLTISGFTAGISQPRAFKGQLLPTAKGANSSRMKFFNAVICLESSLMEFGHTLDQSGQAVIHRRLVPLIFDDGGGGGEQEHVSPRCRGVHVNKNPPLLGSFLATLEGSQNIFVSAVTTQRQPNPSINDFGISRRRIVIPKQTGVQRDSDPLFTQHHKGAKCRDSIGVEVE